MKAARFYEKHKIIVEDIPLKEPNEYEVLIRVRYCVFAGRMYTFLRVIKALPR